VADRDREEMRTMADLATVVCYSDSNTCGFDPVTSARFPRDVRWPGIVAPADGVHLGADGHAVLGRAIATEVRALLGTDGA
jgi:lysophospholipase L1-like esterase